MIKKILQWQSLGHLLREQVEKIGKIFSNWPNVKSFLPSFSFQYP